MRFVSRILLLNIYIDMQVEYVKQEAKIVYLLECLQKTSPPVCPHAIGQVYSCIPRGSIWHMLVMLYQVHFEFQGLIRAKSDTWMSFWHARCVCC